MVSCRFSVRYSNVEIISSIHIIKINIIQIQINKYIGWINNNGNVANISPACQIDILKEKQFN